jgi:tetratricopeptide (TPR) repeat protein
MEDTIMTIRKSINLAAAVSVLLAVANLPLSAGRIEAENYFVEAQKMLSAGEDIQAEKLLKKSLQSDPEFTSAIWQLSQIYESRGKLEHARELLLRGLEQNPDASWARDKLKRLEKILVQKLYSEAEELMSLGEYTAALPKLSLYHGIKPYDPLPLINLARCHLALDNPETARNYLQRGAERDPGNEEIASLMNAVEKRIEDNSLVRERERAERLVAGYPETDRKEVTAALENLLRKEPSNRWAREKLEELNLLSEEASAEGAERKGGGEKRVTGTDSLFDLVPSFSLVNAAAVLLPVIIIGILIAVGKKKRVRYYSLQGNISLIPILDIVSLINSNLKTGWLEISGKNARGEIFFKRGEIIHARYRDKSGNEAFHRIMGITSGRFIFYNHLPKTRQTITDPLSILLLSLKSRNEKRSVKSGRGNGVPV